MEILENREQWSETYRQVWLANLAASGVTDWRIYPIPRNEHTPGAPGIKLGESRLMLISSAGGYQRRSQEPFDAANPLGDYAVRTFSSSTPFQDLAFAHDHYDHALIERDPQVALPLLHLQEIAAAGRVGSLAPSVVSFMGYQPDAARTVDELVPRVLAIAKEEGADAALLAPV
jgi:D-proline reductase (dithiol) PrdB